MLKAVLALNELDTEVFNFQSRDVSPTADDGNAVVVPDAHLLFNGDFQRIGTADLKIVGDDGKSFYIPDYFAAEKRATLKSPEGATLSAHVVEALAGPLAPGQHAQAGGQAAPSQAVIGRVEALSGSATVVRNGVTVTLNVGDQIRQGDVVQTLSGSTVAIALTDGSVFNLSANARMVMSNFVYDAGGTGNASLINLVQGTFSFVAGQVAKTGDMRVETPVATMGIRGTAVFVEISSADGQTTFAVMREPNGDVGSFTLYSKTTGLPIATINNVDGVWNVSPNGNVQQLAKTNEQLAREVSLVQQVFTIQNNLPQNPINTEEQKNPTLNDKPGATEGAQGGGGSSAALSTDGVKNLNTINDALNSSTPTTIEVAATAPQSTGGSQPLPPPPAGSEPPATVPVTVTPVVNQAPVAVDDPGVPGDGNVVGNDSDPEGYPVTVTSGQHIPAGGGPAPTPVVVDADGEAIPGTYGALTLRANGTYSFAASGEAYAHLAAGETVTETFRYTITDPFGGTATALLTITVTGANDAPIIGVIVDTGTVTEDTQTTTASGSLTVSDVDNGATATWSIDIGEGGSATTAQGAYGSLSIDQNGQWTYTLNSAAAQALGPNDHPVESFTIIVADGQGGFDTHVVNVTVNGANDAPVITGVVDTGTVTEDGETTTASGSLTVADPDTSATATWSIDIGEGGSATTAQGAYGSLSINQNGQWTYTLNNGAAQALGADSHPVETFTVRVSDGQGGFDTHIVNVTVNGTNDAPVITGVVDTGTVTEDSETSTASGSLTATDADTGDTLTWSIDAGEGGSATSVQGDYGTLTIDQNGQWTYALNYNLSQTQALGADDHPVETFTVRVDDGQGGFDTHIVSVTVNGANDAPDITGGVDAGTVTEDSEVTTASGTLTANDPDSSDTVSWSIDAGEGGSSTSVQGDYGTLTIDENGHWTYTLDNELAQSLGDDDHPVETFTVIAADGRGGFDTHTVSVTVNGADDVVANDDTAEMDENEAVSIDVLANDAMGADTSKTLTSLGDIEIIAPTTGPNPVVLGTPAIVIQGNKIQITPGTAFDALTVGETATIVIPYTMQTGTGEVLQATATITVHGTNDAPYFDFDQTMPAGWQSIGNVGNGEFGGTTALHINTQSGATQGAVEEFLGLDAGVLDLDPEDGIDATNGSAIAFDLNLAENETVTFSWNFASTEYEPFNDYAFFSVSSEQGADDVRVLSDIETIGDGVDDDFLHSSGWQQFTYEADAAGQYRFGIGVMNDDDSLFDSNLYISGFSGIGFSRETDENDEVETFDLLNGVKDPDTNDVLIVSNIVITDENGEPLDLPEGAVTIDGHFVSIDPDYFDYLSVGETATVVVKYDVSDGSGVTLHNSATLVINGADEPASVVANDDTYVSAVGYDTTDIGTVTEGTQSHPWVASNGVQFIAVWQDESGEYGSNPAIVYRLFNQDGTPVTEPTLANAEPASAESYPRAYTLADGSFALLWSNGEGRLVDADGDAGASFSLASYGFGGYHDLVPLSSGGFVVTSTVDSHTTNFFAVYDSDGTLLETFESPGASAGNGIREAVALEDGGFLFVWKDEYGDLVAQSFDADGTPREPEPFALEDSSGQIVWFDDLDLAQLPDGRILATWSQQGDYGREIYGRILNESGHVQDGAVGDIFTVSDNYSDNVRPTITSLEDGRILVAWYNTGEGESIHYRILDSDGTPLTYEQTLTNEAPGPHYLVTEALSDGSVVLVWRGYDSDAEGPHYAIIGPDGQIAVPDTLIPLGDHVGSELINSITQTEDGSVWITVLDNDPGLDGSGGGITAIKLIAASGITENETRLFDVLANDVDEGPLTLASVGSPTVQGPENVDLGVPEVLIEDNKLKIVPGDAFNNLALGQTATVLVTYTVEDSDGNLDTATATIKVTGTNDAPVITTTATAEGAEDTYSISVDMFADDIDGYVSGFRITSLPTNGDFSLDGFSTVMDEEDLQQLIYAYQDGDSGAYRGTISFRPNPNFNGEVTFQYVAVDNNGAESAPATGTIDVTPVHETVTMMVDTDNGFNTNAALGALLEADVTGFNDDEIYLYYSGEAGTADDLYFTVTGHGFEFDGVPPDISLTGGTITGLYVEGHGDVKLASFNGFDIAAVDIQAAVDEYDETGNAAPFRDLFRPYAYDATGGAGNDAFITGRYDDIIRGGNGNDRAGYSLANAAITVSLAAGVVTIVNGSTDTLRSVENVFGTQFNDVYDATGFGANSLNAGSLGTLNSFEGMGGDDEIIGNGATIITYTQATSGVTVDLAINPETGFGSASGDSSVGNDRFNGVSGVRGSDHNDFLYGSNNATGVESFLGEGGNDLIDGRGGLDRVNYASIYEDAVTGGLNINMATGVVLGDASVGTDTLRSIELVRGSRFADIYDATGFGTPTYNDPLLHNVGSSGTFNEFEGHGGNDTITGNGNTRIAFYNATAGVTVDIQDGTADGDISVGHDTFTGVNGISGSQHADTFYGSNNAQGTSELFDGRAENDFFNGRGGYDIAVYNFDAATTSGIYVDMTAGTVSGDDSIGTDTLRDIEAVRGTNFADTYDASDFGGPYTSDAEYYNVGSFGTFNEFEGLGGNDTITGNGNTSLSYVSATAGVTINLSEGFAEGNASVGTDTILGGVTRVRGSNFADFIIGNAENNHLTGGGGHDTLTGGSGHDTFVFAPGNGHDTINDMTLGSFTNPDADRIDLSAYTSLHTVNDLDVVDNGAGDMRIMLSANDWIDLNGVAYTAQLDNQNFIFAPILVA